MTGTARGISIRKARYIGNFPRTRTSNWVMVGQDGGQTIPCGASTLFLFSDTLLVCANPQIVRAHAVAPVPVPDNLQTVFLANCAARSDANDMESAVGSLQYYADDDGLPREIIPANERDRFRRLRFWPEHGICVNGEVYLYYLGIQTVDPSSVWGFEVLGTGLAALDLETGTCRRCD
jgi:hypothetical protein